VEWAIGLEEPNDMLVPITDPQDRLVTMSLERGAQERARDLARAARVVREAQPRLEAVRGWVVTAGSMVRGRDRTAPASR
jgi:hypothetical protein